MDFALLFNVLGLDWGVVEGSARGDGEGVDAIERPATLGTGVGVEAAIDREVALSTPQGLVQMLTATQLTRAATSAGRVS
ncbi:hypothetical protein ACGFI3_34470 [Nonomuraea wenchangensis]|uniref:hypothetical protein n=1 Tax=Nonomuraea wenchangensis TaxID=568860 RepID=UPI003723EFE1